MEEKYGTQLMREELMRVAHENDAPHVAEFCPDCYVGPRSEWMYCIRSPHHVDHEYHVCPIVQSCDCEEGSY